MKPNTIKTDNTIVELFNLIHLQKRKEENTRMSDNNMETQVDAVAEELRAMANDFRDQLTQLIARVVTVATLDGTLSAEVDIMRELLTLERDHINTIAEIVEFSGRDLGLEGFRQEVQSNREVFQASVQGVLYSRI